MDWKKLLAYITGSVDQELLLRNEYLVAENRVLRAQINGRPRLTDGERKTLAEIGKRLGTKVLEDVASIVRPETILAWHRKLVARKFDGSKRRRYPGRPRVSSEIEKLAVRLAKLILFGEASLRRALAQFGAHFHHERNHQGKGNVLLFPSGSDGTSGEGPVDCRERLGGLLKFYYRRAG